jgi:hypothetical protein
MEDRRSACRVSVGQPEGKRPLKRHKNRREDNIKIDVEEREWGSWIGLIWLRKETYAMVLSTQQYTCWFHKTK